MELTILSFLDLGELSDVKRVLGCLISYINVVESACEPALCVSCYTFVRDSVFTWVC